VLAVDCMLTSYTPPCLWCAEGGMRRGKVGTADMIAMAEMSGGTQRQCACSLPGHYIMPNTCAPNDTCCTS
jgi:hypothetical protein